MKNMTEKRFTKQEVYDGINRYRINESNFIVEILDDGIPMHYSTIVNRLNEQHKIITRLEKENEQLKASLYAEKTNTAEVVNDYSKQFKRHSAQFSFMMDLADDLGVDVATLEALDD